MLPPAAYAYDFVMAHSTPEDDPELVTGLYCYAELVIQQVRPSTALSRGTNISTAAKELQAIQKKTKNKQQDNLKSCSFCRLYGSVVAADIHNRHRLLMLLSV